MRWNGLPSHQVAVSRPSSRNQLGLQAQTFKVLANAHQALGFQVHGYHAGELELDFQDVADLAAGGAAGVEYTLARGQIEQIGSQLGGFVLHTDPAFGKAWQIAYIAGRSQHDAVLAKGAKVELRSLPRPATGYASRL